MLTTWDAVPMLDRVFDDVMRSALGTATNVRSFTPEFDVRATDDEIVFIGDVPGIKSDDLEITLENRVLTIKGERKAEGFGEKDQVMLGRRYGKFEVRYTLPDVVDGENLAADLSDGVLTLRVPKSPKAKPRRIQIGSGNGKLLNK